MNTPRFLVDCMLGKLARRLRALGYDTRFVRYLTDIRLVGLARYEKRILLTRDLELARKANECSLLVHSGNTETQLREVINHLNLTPQAPFTRCLQCNSLLESITRDKVKGRIPLYVEKSFHNFKECPDCKRIFWPGTHQDNLRREFETIHALNAPEKYHHTNK